MNPRLNISIQLAIGFRIIFTLICLLFKMVSIYNLTSTTISWRQIARHRPDQAAPVLR